MSSKIKLVIADDHAIFRDGLKLLLKKQDILELVGEAENGQELIAVTDKFKPDLIITDIKMPVMDGIEACRILKQQYPFLGIIALSMFNDDELIVDMLEAGAKGYLLKNTNKEELLQAAVTVFRGGSYYSKETSQRLTELINNSSYHPARKKPELSPREKEIIILICKEYSNKQIAEALGLNPRTVETHRQNIQEKIGSKNTAGIVLFAVKSQLFSTKKTSS
jgi:DNA-binding NarL/FixJ family response regulator